MATAIADLPDRLLSEGRSWFRATEAAGMADLAVDHVYPGIKRLADKGLIFSPAKGFYVVVPPEFRSWRSVPAERFIDPMMRHLGRRYYVGLLSAAELHGVAHQRPQAFQVMVDRPLPARRAGRTDLRFYLNSHFPTAAMGTKPTPSGELRVSSPAMTALDLAARPRDAGGLHNVATVIIGLVEEGLLDLEELETVAAGYSASSARRVGWILETFADLDVPEHLASTSSSVTTLDPNAGRRGRLDPKWRLIVNAEVVPDL